MWGSCFWFCILSASSRSASRRLLTQLAHTQLPHTQLTHTQLAHTQLAHTQPAHIQLAHTQLAHTQPTHTQLAHTHNLLTHTTCTHTTCTHTTYSHTTYSQTSCSSCSQPAHTQLPHTQLIQRFAWQAWHFVTSTFTLCATCTHTQLAHTQLAHIQLAHTQLTHIHHTHTQLDDMDRHFAWQAWHLWHWVGSGGALDSQAALGRRGVLRGRRGTSWHGSSLCVAGVALDDMDRYFAWQAWHLWHWVGSGGALGSQAALGRCRVLRGRRGTLWHRPSLCVAGVALHDMDRHVGWQAWHLWHWVGSGGALVSQAALGRRGVLRGRRGTLWHRPSLCVAGVALDDKDRHFAWQAWQLMTWIVTLRGRRGTYGTGLALVARLVPRRRWDAAAFCVAGMALCDIDLHFVWQAWHFMTWIVTLRSRRGSWWHGSLLCVAGVALMALGWLWWRAWFPGGAGTPRRFAWHAWHFVTSTFVWQAWHFIPGGAGTPRRFVWQAWHFVTSTFTLCGRRGTQAWHFVTSTFTLCGKRGTSWHGSALCVAGVAVDDMHRYFAWQAWHLWHWVGSGGALGSQAALGRRGVLRGRRGTLWHRPSLCVAGVALHDMDRHFAWQAWHFMTWIVTLGGRRGTYGTGLALVARLVPRRRWDAAAFCVAGVALCDIDLHFVLQAWHFMTWIVTLRGRRGSWWHGSLLCVAGVALMALGWLWWRAWFPAEVSLPYAAWLCIAEVQLEETFWTSWPFDVAVTLSWTWSGFRVQYIPFTAKGASFSLHGLTPCEDLAPERGHVSDRKKDHVHDRSEQFLCNRLPLFLCCLLSVGATLLHLPPSLGRSTTLRCRDLC